MTDPQTRSASASMLAVLALWSIMAAASAESAPDALSTRLASGEAGYQEHCAACHQGDGRGSGAYLPALRGRADLLADKVRLINTVLAGKFDRAGEQNGHTIPLMPTWDYLANEQIADIITFISHTWSDAPFVVTTEEVAQHRGLMLWDETDQSDDDAGAQPVPLDDAEFERANALYFANCVGCHGSTRAGSAGASLPAWFMRERGPGYLASIINYGTHSGMPNWGTSEQLSPADISLLTRYLQTPASNPPPFDATAVRNSWRVLVPVAERPRRPAHDFAIDRMFAAALHDTGHIMLIDGRDKTIIANVHVGYAPHRVAMSGNHRYLYVARRDGTISAIDLYMNLPAVVAVVAEVRIGFEARALAARHARRALTNRSAGLVVAGAYTPGQFAVLDGATLEPRSVARLPEADPPDPSAGLAQATDAGSKKVSDLIALPGGNVLATSIDDDRVHVIDLGRPGRPRVTSESASSYLRAGSMDISGRYVLATADNGRVVAFDARRETVVANLAAPGLTGGAAGTAATIPDHGPVWITSTMAGADVIAVGTDPRRHPGTAAWRIVERLAGHGAGSLHVATHPESRNLWMDTPLNANPEISQRVSVFDLDRLDAPSVTLPIARWSELGPGVKRVLHPQYNQAGDEVWFVVWNPQNLASALVIIDDRTRSLKHVIRDNRLITPIRNFSLASLRR